MTGSRSGLFYMILTVVPLTNVSQGIERSHYCASPQNGTIGQKGVIKCNVTVGFIRIYWFNGRDERSPLIGYEDKIIPGYTTNHYDILSNGSLVINNVSREHEGHFKLVVIYHDFVQFEEEVQYYVNDQNNDLQITTQTSTTVQTTTPSLKNSRTSTAPQSFETTNGSVSAEDNIDNSTQVTLTFLSFRSSTSHQSETLSLDDSDKNSSNRHFSCNYVQLFLILYFALLRT